MYDDDDLTKENLLVESVYISKVGDTFDQMLRSFLPSFLSFFPLFMLSCAFCVFFVPCVSLLTVCLFSLVFDN